MERCMRDYIIGYFPLPRPELRKPFRWAGAKPGLRTQGGQGFLCLTPLEASPDPLYREPLYIFSLGYRGINAVRTPRAHPRPPAAPLAGANPVSNVLMLVRNGRGLRRLTLATTLLFARNGIYSTARARPGWPRALKRFP